MTAPTPISAAPEYVALTLYGVRIPRAFAGRADALRWADKHGDDFPGCRIVMRTKNGQRLVWKHQEARVAA